MLLSVSADWEAAKIAEPAKEATSQAVSAEPTAVSNTQTEAYNQQVPMMPVQVPKSVFLSLGRMQTAFYLK